MRIVHFSDWHTSPKALPDADLYICTGDMYENFGQRRNPFVEGEMQRNWAGPQGQGSDYFQVFRDLPGPVVCVRGNHDFTDLVHLFPQGVLFEVNNDPSRTVEVQGLKLGGWRGVGGNFGWCDEKSERLMEMELQQLPDDLDVLITHDPPKGTLDYCGRDNGNIGSSALAHWVAERGQTLKLHCFGHAHGLADVWMHPQSTTFSNAALTYNVIDGDKEHGFRVVDM